MECTCSFFRQLPRFYFDGAIVTKNAADKAPVTRGWLKAVSTFLELEQFDHEIDQTIVIGVKSSQGVAMP